MCRGCLWQSSDNRKYTVYVIFFVTQRTPKGRPYTANFMHKARGDVGIAPYIGVMLSHCALRDVEDAVPYNLKPKKINI